MQPSIGTTLGPGFLGALGSAILFGVTIIQTYLYYGYHANDWIFQKILVAVLLVLDAVHLAAITHGMYRYMITDFRNADGLEVIVWSFKLQTALNVVVVLLVQSLYSLRIWRLGKRFSRFWPSLVILIVVGGYAAGILLAIEIYNVQTFAELQQINWAIETSFSTSTGIDILLAVAMCICLHKCRTPFRRTNSKVLNIMNYVIISGILTSACSLICILIYVTMRNTMVLLGISFLLTRLYISSYMAMLNAKRVTRDQESSSINVSQFTELRNIRPHGPYSTNPWHMAPKTEVDSFQMSTLDYSTKTGDDFSEGANVSRKASTKSGVIGIIVHTTEERNYE